MKSYVFTISEDVCTVNGKDPNATELLEVMKTYGKVESYESNIANLKTTYQKTIDNLTAEYNRIKAYNLSDDEITLLSTYRNCKELTVSALNAEIERHKTIASDLQATHTAYVEKIKGMLASLSEQA